MEIDLRTAQLLCSRICHDLVGPMGAVNAGVELIGEEGTQPGDPLDEALGLIASSAGQAAARVSFFRIAFGAGSGGGDSPLKDAHVAAQAFLAQGRVNLDWELPAVLPDLSLASVKLLLNMVLLGAEAMPRGGDLRIKVTETETGTRLEADAAGKGAALMEEVRLAMTPEAVASTLTARNVVAHFAASLAESLGSTLEVSEGEPGRVRLQALVKAGPEAGDV